MGVVMSDDGIIKLLTKTFVEAQEKYSTLMSQGIAEQLNHSGKSKPTKPQPPELPEWRQSPTNPGIGVLTFAINIEGGGEILIDFEMPIHEIVEHTSEGFKGQLLGHSWKHTNPEWHMPFAKAFIRTKLDEMGYDFIESKMLAIKRSGIWR